MSKKKKKCYINCVAAGDAEFKQNKHLPAEKQIVTANPDINTVCIFASLFTVSWFKIHTHKIKKMCSRIEVNDSLGV